MTTLRHQSRESGVLLHITSLPGGEGIGDLGQTAHLFVDWLVQAGQRWWQVLPCGEVGFGESPYQSVSAYAGNTLLISLQALAEDGLLDERDLLQAAAETSVVDFVAVREHKSRQLTQACRNFATAASTELLAEFAEFRSGPAQHWLTDYARFVVLKEKFDARPWNEWPAKYSRRDHEALAQFDIAEKTALLDVQLQQFLFYRQWHQLHSYAKKSGVRLMGDCPIYVAADSADVWVAPELFDLRDDGSPRVVAGVPPDYFSATGQLWGNPLYRWDVMSRDAFSWWRARMQHSNQQFDLTRIDHFRGLEAYWEVPADAPDASWGTWQPGPGAALLKALQTSLSGDAGVLPLVAEDLGELTEAVHELRAEFGLLGMRVLQFGFEGGEDNPHSVGNIGDDVVFYAGTHDNNTTLGWLEELHVEACANVLRSLNARDNYHALTLIIDQVLGSSAPLAVLTMQDLLQLDARSRFNTPGSVGDNWRWRLRSRELGAELAASLAGRSASAGRLAPEPAAQAFSFDERRLGESVNNHSNNDSAPRKKGVEDATALRG